MYSRSGRLFGFVLLCETTYGEPAVAVAAVGGVRARAAEVGVVSAGTTADSTRPIVAA